MVDGPALALRRRQIGRQPLAVARVHQLGQLTIEQIGHIGHGILQAVHGKGDMPAVEVTAVKHTLLLGVDQWIVVGRIQLAFHQLAHERQGVFQHANHMRGAAQRIAILQAVRIAQRRLGHQVRADAGRHALLTRVGLGGKQGLIKMVCIARNTHHIGRCDAAGQLTHILRTLPGQAGQCCHHGCAIHQRQAFLGA